MSHVKSNLLAPKRSIIEKHEGAAGFFVVQKTQTCLDKCHHRTFYYHASAESSLSLYGFNKNSSLVRDSHQKKDHSVFLKESGENDVYKLNYKAESKAQWFYQEKRPC